MKHFKHCYAYEGAHCSCDAELIGGYEGSQAGPNMELPPTPFTLDYEVPPRPTTDAEFAQLPVADLSDFYTQGKEQR